MCYVPGTINQSGFVTDFSQARGNVRNTAISVLKY